MKDIHYSTKPERWIEHFSGADSLAKYQERYQAHVVDDVYIEKLTWEVTEGSVLGTAYFARIVQMTHFYERLWKGLWK